MARKTLAMRLLERNDPRGRAIQQIICDTYAEHGSLEKAAESLGVHIGTFHGWIRALGGNVEQQSRIVFPESALEARDATAA
jgi:AraC-like DNA-binding protein